MTRLRFDVTYNDHGNHVRLHPATRVRRLPPYNEAVVDVYAVDRPDLPPRSLIWSALVDDLAPVAGPLDPSRKDRPA